LRGEFGQAFHARLESHRGMFTLWGTRGSVPTPGAQFLRHGGQTSCMQVSLGDDVVVLDAGSGIRNLGLELAAGPPRRIHLFITHTHWDHIQGFPFFKPAYMPGFDIVIYGAEAFGKDLRSLFGGQLDRDYFPVQMADMRADLTFRHLTENPVNIGPLKVYWEFAHHPGATVGYKVNVLGRKLAWFPDNEFLNGYLGAPELITRDHDAVTPYSRLIEFLSDVDVLIHEAQYTTEEYPDKVGWGHSSLPNACVLAKLAGVPRWIVTHHDPLHDDRFLETKLNLTRQLLARIAHPIPVAHAYDGLTEYL
jgi:phosphoribosyl 1,2-cyclic phosphodiesterase